MSDVLEEQEPQPPRGHVRVVYLGPVAPHWDVQSDYGDETVIDQFRDRTLARLTLLPPHDPQFRRNRERVVRDAERELLELEWDLGVPDEPEAESETDDGRGRRLSRTRPPADPVSPRDLEAFQPETGRIHL